MGKDISYITVEKLQSFMKDAFIGLGYPEEQAKASANSSVSAIGTVTEIIS